MWFEGEIRDGFQPLSLFLESSIQAPDSSIWGLLTRMPFNAGVFLLPPCLESWGDEVGLPCWVPIAGCFSVEFLIHSRTFPFILLWSFSLNFVILEFLLWHSAYLPLFSQRTHQCSPLPLPQTNLLFIYSLGTFDDSAPPWVRVPLTPFIHQGRDSWFTLMLEFSSETPDCTKGISSSLTQGTRHPIPALGHKHFVSSQSWLMPSPHLCYTTPSSLSSWVSSIPQPEGAMDSPSETTYLSPVSPKTPTLLPRKSKGSKILPTTPCRLYSVQVSLLYLDFCCKLEDLGNFQTHFYVLFITNRMSPRRSSHPKERGVFYLTSQNILPLYFIPSLTLSPDL